MANFRGTGVAVLTPFRLDLSIDTSALASLLRFQVDAGVEYLVALGTTGETPTLSEAEQDQVLDIFFSTVGDQVPIVIGAGGNDTRKVGQKIAYWSRKYSPAGFLSVCPYYNKPSQQGLITHFTEIAQNTDAAIMLYNVPGRTQVNMEAETTLHLANNISNITAIKESSGDLGQCMRILAQKPADFQVLSGDDILSLAISAMGGEGLVSVLANVLPGPVGEMVRTFQTGDIGTARALYLKMAALMELCFTEGNPAGIKALGNQRNLCSPTVRPPLIQASASLTEAIQNELAEFFSPASPSNISNT